MNQKASIIAFVFFTIAWIIGFDKNFNIIPIMNVGLMWLTAAAIIGR